jgi:hypothetical protein
MTSSVTQIACSDRTVLTVIPALNSKLTMDKRDTHIKMHATVSGRRSVNRSSGSPFQIRQTSFWSSSKEAMLIPPLTMNAPDSVMQLFLRHKDAAANLRSTLELATTSVC